MGLHVPDLKLNRLKVNLLSQISFQRFYITKYFSFSAKIWMGKIEYFLCKDHTVKIQASINQNLKWLQLRVLGRLANDEGFIGHLERTFTSGERMIPIAADAMKTSQSWISNQRVARKTLKWNSLSHSKVISNNKTITKWSRIRTAL